MNLLDENTMRTRGRRGCEIERGCVGRTPVHGFSIIEVVVALSVAALALAIVLPTLSRRGQAPENLAADLQDFSLNLQVARDLTVSRGTHYRVRITSQTAYLLEVAGPLWVTERAINLRPNVAFASGDVGKIAEYDTRGMCVSSACTSSPPIVYTMSDVARGWSRQVKVYARGLVDRP